MNKIKTLIKNHGQVGILQLVGIGSAILIAAVGQFIAQSRYADEKIAAVGKDNVQAVQRISNLEARTPILENDVKEIKADIKELLRRIK